MNISDYIATHRKPLRPSTKLSKAISLFKELRFTHLPVVENGKLLGMLSYRDALYSAENTIFLSELSHLFEPYRTSLPAHPIDLISLFVQNNTNILPAVDKDQNYEGYFELDEIVYLLYNTPFLKEHGTTLIVEKDKQNTSINEVTQIIEANDVQILGIYVSQITPDKIQITLRVNTQKVNEIIQSLRRYEYNVLTNSEDDVLLEQLKERTEYLQRFLDV